MAEPPDFDFTGVDAERPLRPEQRARLEAALSAAAATAPVVVPEETTEAAPALTLDAPRPLPPAMRARLEAAVLGAAGRPVAVRWTRAALAMAAVLALLLGSVALLNQTDSSERDVTAAAPTSPTQAAKAETPQAGESAPAAATPSPSPAPAASPSAPKAAVAAPVPKASVVPKPSGPVSGAPKAAPAPAAAGSPAPGSPAPPGGGPPAPAPAPAPASGGAAPAGGTAPEDPGPPPPYAYPGTGPGSQGESASALRGDTNPPPAAPAQPDQPDSPAPAPDKPERSGSAEAGPAATGEPIWVGVVGGDKAQEAGFTAYLEALNRSGGLRGRPLRTVGLTPGTAAPETVVTVNLSARPLASPGGAPGWATGALLETLTASEDLLRGGGRVLSFASPPERQAHLVADAVFPGAAPGATAVIYRGESEPWARLVPRAIEAVLAKRGVKVETLPYDPDRPPALFRSVDAAFLSLDTETARLWLRQAKVTGYAPARGVAGIFSLFDETLLGDLPEGATLVSPYVLPGGEEGKAIRALGAPSAATLHGWATAKMLAVALWQSGADTPDEALAAIGRLEGYDSGLAPPYQTRPDTRSRTPEGVVIKQQAGAFRAQGGFRRDSF